LKSLSNKEELKSDIVVLTNPNDDISSEDDYNSEDEDFHL
jgi:hypothetical protein